MFQFYSRTLNDLIFHLVFTSTKQIIKNELKHSYLTESEHNPTGPSFQITYALLFL